MENIVGIDMHKKCHHKTTAKQENHQHHEEHSDHHHSCTPFCACGITHFVLHVPQIQTISTLPLNISAKGKIPPSTLWIIPADNYKKLITQDIWQPPQTV